MSASSYGNAADVIASSPTRRGINIFTSEDAPVVAVNDGVIQKSGNSEKLGNYVVLEDAYGNRYTYAKLGKIVRDHREVVMPTGTRSGCRSTPRTSVPGSSPTPGATAPGSESDARNEVDSAAATGSDGTLKSGIEGYRGTVIGRVGAGADGVDPHINFSISPAGRGAPRIDPKPILDGWKLLEATAIYRAKGKNPFAAEARQRRGPAALQGGAAAARARRRPPRHLRLRAQRHRQRADRPPSARDARVPRREGLRPDDHLAQVRPRRSSPRAATSPTTAPATRSTSPPSTASRSSATRARARSPTWCSRRCSACRARWPRRS